MSETKADGDRIVAAMVKAGYPVEATNKAGHTPDCIPFDHYGPWTDKVCGFTGNRYDEENLARALVGGWHTKAALIQLVIEARRAALSRTGEGDGEAEG